MFKKYFMPVAIVLCVLATIISVDVIVNAMKDPVIEYKKVPFYVQENVVVEHPKTIIEQPENVKLEHKIIKKLRLPTHRTLTLFGTVGENALNLAYTINLMNDTSSDPIYIVIDSPGGSVLDGAVLLSAMQASKAPVHTICYGMCASMAAVILEYGDIRYATDRSVIMFHPATTGARGDVDRIVSLAGFLQRYLKKIDLYIAARIGIPYEEFKNKASIEWWIDAEDGIEANVVDQLVYVRIGEELIKPSTSEARTNRKMDLLW